MTRMGRPKRYSKDLADEICFLIAQGNSMRKVAAMEKMPCGQTIFSWFRDYPDFLEQYTRAKEESADSDQDKLDEIAEKVLTGEYEPQPARVAADIIKWSASKKKPKKYGDRQQIEHSGKIGLSDLTDNELAQKLEDLENNED